MRGLNKDLLKKQAEVFVSWGLRSHVGTTGYKYWLDWFCKHTQRVDILDVTTEDLEKFLEIVENTENARYRKAEARRAVYSFARYYMARSRNGKIRLSRGRPPAIESYKEVGKLREKNKLSFRKIGMMLNPDKPVDVGQVYRWYERFLGLKK